MNVVEPITVGPVGAGYLPEIDMSRPPRLTRRDVFLLSVAIAIVATIVVGSILFREKIEEIGGIGYVGIVLANAIGSATIVLPVPTIATVVIGATIWNPVLVGIAGATGSTIGEFTAYVAGASARSGVDRMMAENRWYSRAESWMKRRGFLTVFLLAATPNPFMDFGGIAAGSLGYSARKFIVACWLGKVVKYMPIALASYWWAEEILRFLD